MISLVNKLKIQNSLIKSNSLCFLSQRSKYLIETDELFDLIQTEQKDLKIINTSWTMPFQKPSAWD